MSAVGVSRPPASLYFVLTKDAGLMVPGEGAAEYDPEAIGSQALSVG